MTSTTTNACSIRCDAVSVSFAGGVTAVDDVTLLVRPGEFFSLIGPSGCGKTTLLRMMAGLQPATGGQVWVDPPADAKSGEVAFVFQQPSLLPWRTTLDNAILPLELIGRATRKERVSLGKEMLKLVGLEDVLDRLPNQLSGGMKMRVSIARALVTQPSVLLLDEPFAALDDMLRTQLGQLLLKLWKEFQFTAVMVTHNIAESVLLSQRIGVMRCGRLVATMENPLPWPRQETLRGTLEFGRFYGDVSRALRGES